MNRCKFCETRAAFLTVQGSREVIHSCNDDTCVAKLRKVAEQLERQALEAGNLCNYSLPNGKACGKMTLPHSYLCDEHREVSCSWPGCSKGAVKSCDFRTNCRCGAPLCDSPDHSCCPEHNLFARPQLNLYGSGFTG